jgi:hypothetical protein
MKDSKLDKIIFKAKLQKKKTRVGILLAARFSAFILDIQMGIS